MLRMAKFIIGWPISIAALFFIVKITSPHFKTIFSNLEKINWLFLILSIFCFLIYYFVRSSIWKLILKEKGYNIPLRVVSYLWEMSELKRFVPGAIWSFLGKTSLFGELGIPTKTVFKSILIEIEFFVLACLFVSTLSFPYLFQKVITFIPYKPFLPILATASVFLTTFIFIFSTPILNRINIKYCNPIKRLLPLFSPKTNLIIFLTAVTYTFFFGLGTYFAAISVAYLSPAFILSLIGFFVFSLVAGFLSMIAPMGIGIREGIITIGLSKHLSLTIAGFISIFARILLIFSELCFILFVTSWHKAKNKYIMAFENFISKHKQEVILGFLITAYIAYFTTASFLRYDNFYTGRFDLGNMTQTVWNTIHGRMFELTDPNGTEIISRLAFHADFILILLSPFYLLWENPKMLLLIQTVIIAIGAFFVYAIAKHAIKNKNLSLVFGAIYLLNPSLNYTNLYDFHAVTFATTFLLASFYFLLRRRYVPLIIFLILSGLTKEHVWLITGLFGVYIFFPKVNNHLRPRRSHAQDLRGRLTSVIGIIIFIVSILLFYYLIWHAISNALGSKHFALNYYSDFGDSPTQIVKNIFLSPQKTLTVILQKDQLTYLKNLFLPVGFMPVFAFPFITFAIPDLLINLLSKNANLHQIYYQYSATITPFIFIASIFGVGNLKKWFPTISTNIYISYLLLSTLTASYFFGPLPPAQDPNIAMFTKPQKEKKIINDFVHGIPPTYSVAATNNIGSHLSHRQKIFTIPVGLDQADYILFLLNDLSAQPSLKFQKDLAIKLSLDKNYIEVFRTGDFVAFRKVNL